MTTLLNAIKNVNAIFSANKLANTDKKTFFGHSNSKGLQGQTDLALLGNHPKIDYTSLTSFCCTLARLETSLKTTASCQEAALSSGKNKGIAIELKPHDAYHGVWKAYQKLQYLTGNSGQRDAKQLVRFFTAVNGNKLETLEKLQAAIMPLFKEISDLKTNLLLEGKNNRVHCFVYDDKGVNELQERSYNLQEKVNVKHEIESAWQSMPETVPTIDLEAAYKQLEKTPISATVIIRKKKTE